jgi:hypothetical protein
LSLLQPAIRAGENPSSMRLLARRAAMADSPSASVTVSSAGSSRWKRAFGTKLTTGTRCHYASSLLRRIRAHAFVTFVELARWFPAFRGGDQVILRQDNAVP